MTKLSKRKLDPEHFGHYINNLWSAFTLLTSKEDIRLLFKDIFTHTEYKMFAKRLEIARRLLMQESYEQIEKALNVTSRTITSVNNVLSEKGDGFRKVHEKFERIEDAYWKKQKEITKNLENPFRKKAQRKTVGGALLKAGAIALDKVIVKKIKEKSAKKYLDI